MAIAHAQLEALVQKTELYSKKMGPLAVRMTKKFIKNRIKESGETDFIKQFLYEGAPANLYSRNRGDTWGTNVLSDPLMMVFQLKKLWFPIKLTGLQKDREVLLDGKQSSAHQISAGMDRSQYDMGRMLYGDGSGILSILTAVGTGVNTVSVSTLKHLALNQYIDIYTSAGVATVTNRLITSIDSTNLTITFSGAADNFTVDDEVYITGNRNKEIAGLLAFINDGSSMPGTKGIATIGELTRGATHPLYNAHINRGVGGAERDLTLKLIAEAVDGIYSRKTGANITAAYAAGGTAYAYAKLIEDKRSFVGNDIDVDFGGSDKEPYPPIFTQHARFPLITDTHIEEGMILFVTESDFTIHGSQGFNFKTGPGMVDKYFLDISVIDDEDAYKALMTQDLVVTGQPAKHGALTDIKPAWNTLGSIYQ